MNTPSGSVGEQLINNSIPILRVKTGGGLKMFTLIP